MPPIALSGLVWYFSAALGKPFRPLGYIVLCSAAIFIFFKGKAYYLLPAYPILFAAGGVALEPVPVAPSREWRGKTYVAVLILAGFITLPFGVPVLPLDSFLRYQRMFPLTHEVKSERDSTSELPQFYADEFGWPDMAATSPAYITVCLPQKGTAAPFSPEIMEKPEQSTCWAERTASRKQSARTIAITFGGPAITPAIA